jgi:membrane-associated phospholipid phosphatase
VGLRFAVLTFFDFAASFPFPFFCFLGFGKLLAFFRKIGYTVSMRYDYKTLYEKNAAFYHARPKAKKCILALNLILTGVFFLSYGAFVLYAIFSHFSAPELMKILGLPAACLFLVHLLRLAIERPRPYSKQGAAITPLLQKSGSENKSFPSRHLACAFVIATVILAYLAGAGICLLVLGGVLGYIRFALGLHYPSDLIGGAILGFVCGIFAFIL